MNNVFTAKLLQSLRNKKGEKGFTLIELLVVVIIIGVLAAVALPNLLGQVGKARESEAKNIIGALNRAQQSRFVERGSFAGNTVVTPTAPIVAAATAGTIAGDNYISQLEVPTTAAQYYAFGVPEAGLQIATGTHQKPGEAAVTNHNLNEGTRDYVGVTHYYQDTRDFATIVCRSMSEATGYDLSTPADARAAVPEADAATAAAQGVLATFPAAGTDALTCLATVGDASETEEVR